MRYSNFKVGGGAKRYIDRPSKVYQGSVEGLSKVYQGSIKGLSRVYQGSIEGLYQWPINGPLSVY